MGGNQILTSGEQTFASLKRGLEGKCLWHFLEQWRYNKFRDRSSHGKVRAFLLRFSFLDCMIESREVGRDVLCGQ